MIRVNGSLRGDLTRYHSKGTIGTAYDVQALDTGYWINYGTLNSYYKLPNMTHAKEWKQIDVRWYYFDSNGRMALNTIIDGYRIGTDGVWIQ